MYSAWGLLLQRYNNTGDVVFGTTVSGRNAGVKGIEDMVGLFINTVPLRVKTGTPPGVTGTILPGANIERAALVQQIDGTLRRRQEYEGTSLVDIKEYSEINSNEELFDNILVIENYPLDKQLAQKESVLSVETYSMTEETNYDLTVGITLFEGMEITLSYDKKHFEKERIVGLTHHFKNILQDIITNPRQPVSTVQMMSDNEIRQVIHEFNATGAHATRGIGTHYPHGKTIHELFEDQVKKTPDSISIIGRGKALPPLSTPSTQENPLQESPSGVLLPTTYHLPATASHIQLTYRELNEKAAHLATQLQKKGITPGTISGMAVTSSVETVIAILAIWKAGGTYLPIDIALPAERVKYMLADANASALLCVKEAKHGREQETLLAELSKRIEVIRLEKELHRPPSSVTTPAPDKQSRHSAYVIYTSGTTGKPKGVMVPHSAFVNRLNWLQSRYGFDNSDVIIQKTPITFDVSLCELFRWIPGGGRLVIMEQGGEREPTAIVEAIVKNR
ncbi:MAG: AMP-binding protein, partial [bacterium]|nr:AMP-binding protein [bacterium]